MASLVICCVCINLPRSNRVASKDSEKDSNEGLEKIEKEKETESNVDVNTGQSH